MRMLGCTGASDACNQIDSRHEPVSVSRARYSSENADPDANADHESGLGSEKRLARGYHLRISPGAYERHLEPAGPESIT